METKSAKTAAPKKIKPKRAPAREASVSERLALLETQVASEKLARADWATLSSLLNDVANFIEKLETLPEAEGRSSRDAAQARKRAEDLYQRILDAKKQNRAEREEP